LAYSELLWFINQLYCLFNKKSWLLLTISICFFFLILLEYLSTLTGSQVSPATWWQHVSIAGAISKSRWYLVKLKFSSHTVMTWRGLLYIHYKLQTPLHPLSHVIPP
jgi:hypothetical protein